MISRIARSMARQTTRLSAGFVANIGSCELKTTCTSYARLQPSWILSVLARCVFSSLPETGISY
jgi:hypothetical protein